MLGPRAVDLFDDFLDLRDLLGNAGKGFGGFIGDPHTCINPVRRVLDQIRSFARRLGGPSRKVAHLLCHHGKAAPVLSRPRRLDRRVQRQKVGLESDFVNHLDDLGDVL